MRKLTIQRQISLLAAFLIVSLIGSNLLAYVMLAKMESEFHWISTEITPSVQISSFITENILLKEIAVEEYLLTGDAQWLEKLESLENELQSTLKERSASLSGAEQETLQKFSESNAVYASAFQNEVIPLFQNQTKLSGVLADELTPRIKEKLNLIISMASQNRYLDLLNHTNMLMQDFLVANILILEYLDTHLEKYIEQASLEIHRAEEEFEWIQKFIDQIPPEKADPELSEWFQAIQADFDLFKQKLEELKITSSEFNHQFHELTAVQGAQIREEVSQFKSQKWDELEHETTTVSGWLNQSKLWLLAVVGVVVLLSIAASIGIIRWMTSILKKTVQTLSESTNDLSIGAIEMETGSLKLSEDASEQAASLQETSSAMEEISSQTKENESSAVNAVETTKKVVATVQESTDKINEVAIFSKNAQESAHQGHLSMSDIVVAMETIREGSDKIQGIIDVINDIAHQTKMLATNAAIEAARAGEQGKGFAVVADEVSKLAESSKEAAKEIAELIQESSGRAAKGSKLAEKGQSVLKDIVEQSSEVTRLLDEVAASSKKQVTQVWQVSTMIDRIQVASLEQTNGIVQVNQSLIEMDSVTQNNAATAETTSGTATGLMLQVEALKEVVGGISTYIGMKAEVEMSTSSQKSLSGPQPKLPAPNPSPSSSHTPAPSSSSSSSPIPMRDDFKDF